MSVNADFYSFSKRKNSTKQPTGAGTQIGVDLKSGTSLVSPTFLIYSASRPTFNYVVFEGWYYFIADIINVRNELYEVVCEIDPLATGKAAVLATTAYVLYDSVSNTEIPDNRLPMKTTAVVKQNSVAFPYTVDSGCYILSITGANGSTGIYKATSGEIAALIDDLSHIEDNIFDFSHITPPQFPTTITIESVLTYIGELYKYMIDIAIRPITQFFGSGNIPENIRECKFIPFNRGTTTPGPDPLCLGTFETQQQLNKLNTKTVNEHVDISIPWPTGIGTGDYRRRSPYTELYLYLPYIGMIRLSSENLANESTLSIDYSLGLLDGALVCTVKAGSEVIGQYSGNVAASTPIGISNINIQKGAQALIAGVAAIPAGNIGQAGMAALSYGEAVTPNYSCIGGLEGVAATAADQNIRCYSVFHDTIVPPNTGISTIGAPSMRTKSLASLTDFCQCLDAHVEADLPSSILDTIDNYLNSGFFIE